MDIIFILVEPAVPENIGAAARSIKTMGFSRMRLVRPVNLHDPKVRIVAYGSHDILEKAEVFESFDQSIEDLDLVIATSAKKRRTNEDYLHGAELFSYLHEKQDSLGQVGIVFGSEESGLSNPLIRRCDLISFIPLAASYPSLNLSHAVMLYAYLLSGFHRADPEGTVKPAKGSLKALKEKTQEVLTHIEMKQLHIIGPRITERMSFLKKDDINLLHSVCNAYLKKHKS